MVRIIVWGALLIGLVGCQEASDQSTNSCADTVICGPGTFCDEAKGRCSVLGDDGGTTVDQGIDGSPDAPMDAGALTEDALPIEDALPMEDALPTSPDVTVTEMDDGSLPEDAMVDDGVTLDAAPDAADMSAEDATPEVDAQIPEPRCDDGLMNGDETDSDCGGECRACPHGSGCLRASDCRSRLCLNNVCQEPTCEDGLRNGDESDLDCGGDCGGCEVGRLCLIGTDCESFICSAGLCLAPTCVDGVQNGDEPDVDCGGPCPACGPGLLCGTGDDCESRVCQGGACVAPRCGDGVINGAEACDDGNESDADGCTSTCQLARCGDGLVFAGVEACDDGGESATCDLDCSAAICGDGVVNVTSGERCDDGGPSAECNADCTISVCGDGTLNLAAGETCDDGNRLTEACPYGDADCDVCDADCRTAAGAVRLCGDGVLDPEEACDDGGESALCDADCTPSLCGDGVHNQSAGEDCDDQGQSPECNADCSRSVCGDGIRNVFAGESCDDGNQLTETCEYGREACVVCSAQCELTMGAIHVCGDHVVDAPEACDDGNRETEDCDYGLQECVVCAADCRETDGRVSYCGDAVINGDEQCDGGERCTATCESIPIPSVSFEVLSSSLFEGGAVPGRVRINLSESLPIELSVSVQFQGTAERGQDYLVNAGGVAVEDTVTIPARARSVDMVLTPVITAEMERSEWIALSLAPSADIILTPDSDSVRLEVYEFGPSPGSVYYVSPEGDDDGEGTEADPFATIPRALDAMESGDTLYIFDGIYTNPGFSEDHGENGDQNNSNGVLARVDFAGAPDRWTRIAAYPDGNEVRPVLKFDGSGGIKLGEDASYIIIEGLEIYGPNESLQYEWAHEHRWSKEALYTGRGIYTWGPVHHVVVRDCHVHHTPNSGIRFNKADYILVENNVVSNATWWSSSAESGIVIATAEHIDEEPVVKILYSGNTVYNNWNFMEFCSGPGGPVGGHQGSDEDVYGNCDRYTGGIIDGQGLYVTRNNSTYLHGRMRFENNIAFNNGFGGVVYHKTDRGELVNNLVFMNGAFPGTSNYTGMTVNRVNDLVIRNNIIWARDGNDYALKNNGNAADIQVSGNLIIGRTQFGDVDQNSILSFDQAPDFESIFVSAQSIEHLAPDPHQVEGPNSPAQIDASVRSLLLNFYPVPNAALLLRRGEIDGAPPNDLDGKRRPSDGVDIGPYQRSSP